MPSEGTDLPGTRPSYLLFASALLVTLHSIQNNLSEKPPKNCPRRVLLDLKGQEYLLFRIYLERNNLEKLLLLAAVLTFTHFVLDAFTISPSLIKYTSHWGQWKKAESIFSSGELSSLSGQATNQKGPEHASWNRGHKGEIWALFRIKSRWGSKALRRKRIRTQHSLSLVMDCLAGIQTTP